MSDFDALLSPRSEHAIQNETLMRITAMSGVFAYRQNSGTAWQGQPIDVPPGEYVRVTHGMKILANARPIDFGLPGSGDIVGQRYGKAFQIEMKTTEGRQETTQKNFEREWVKRGGIYILARSASDAEDGLRKIQL